MLFYIRKLADNLFFICQLMVFGVKLHIHFDENFNIEIFFNLENVALMNSLSAKFYFKVDIFRVVKCLKSKFSGFANNGVIK